MGHFGATQSPLGQPLVFGQQPGAEYATFCAYGAPWRLARPGEEYFAKHVIPWGEPPAGVNQFYAGPSAAEKDYAYRQWQAQQRQNPRSRPSHFGQSPQADEPSSLTPARPKVSCNCYKCGGSCNCSECSKSREPKKRAAAEPSYFWKSFLFLIGALIWCVPCWYIIATMNANADAMSVKGVAQALVGLWFFTTWFVALGGIVYFIAGICSLARSSSQ
jgi:hypothetical protein